jgi:hypothetical protein
MVAFKALRPVAGWTAMGVLLAGAAAGPASASLVIDDFSNGGTFPAVIANQLSSPTTAFFLTAGALGGERDVMTRLDQAVAYPGDNAYGQIYATGGAYFGNTLSVKLDYGAQGTFRVQYDGIDGDMALGPGLNLDAAAAGDHISLWGERNAFLGSNSLPSASNLTVTLVDAAGRSAALTRTLSFDFQTLDYGFADFAALKPSLNFHNIRSIELSGTLLQASPLTGDLEIGRFGIEGDRYVFTPAPDPISSAPEPMAWALMIAGFGMAGAALRTRRRLAA